MATVADLKTQLNQLRAAGKTESTSKQAGKIAKQIRELEGRQQSQGIPEVGGDLGAGISAGISAVTPAAQRLESTIGQTSESYQNLINAIRGQQQVAEQQQTQVTAQELARRGLTPTSGVGAQQIASAIAPVQAQFAQQAAQTGVQGIAAQNQLASQIAGILASGGQAGLSTGINLSNLALQQRQLEQQAAQQAAAQALAQRQFEQATLPMTQAQIANLQQQQTAPSAASDILSILFPQQMTTPKLQFTPEETSTLENLWESDSSPTAVTNGMTRVPQAPRNPLIGRSFT